jgi:hypothetical protein
MLGIQQTSFTTFIQQTALVATSIGSLFKAPLINYVGCPLIKYSGFDNSYCDILSTAITIAQIATTTGSTLQAIAADSVSNVVKSTITNTYQYTLPAGLGAYVVKSIIYGETPSIDLFAIGMIKSSFEMTVTQSMVKSIFINTNHLIAGAVCGINIAKTTNTLFYSIKEIVGGRELNSNLLNDGEDYALGYAIARPFYQIGTIANDNNHPITGASLFFAAPICRGYALGISEKGSVMIPGSKASILKNIIDGAAIATASMTRTYLDQIVKTPINQKLQLPATILSYIVPEDLLTKVGAGNFVTIFLLGTETLHQSVVHKDQVKEFIDNTITILTGLDFDNPQEL